eukprot:1378709-Rhodomonas_salina.3
MRTRASAVWQILGLTEPQGTDKSDRRICNALGLDECKRHRLAWAHAAEAGGPTPTPAPEVHFGQGLGATAIWRPVEWRRHHDHRHHLRCGVPTPARMGAQNRCVTARGLMQSPRRTVVKHEMEHCKRSSLTRIKRSARSDTMYLKGVGARLGFWGDGRGDGHGARRRYTGL